MVERIMNHRVSLSQTQSFTETNFVKNNYLQLYGRKNYEPQSFTKSNTEFHRDKLCKKNSVQLCGKKPPCNSVLKNTL